MATEQPAHRLTRLQFCMNRRGITLLELLVYIGVTTIFVIAASGALFALLATSRQTDVLREQRIELSLLKERIGMLVEKSYDADGNSSFGVNLATNPSHIDFRSQDTSQDPSQLYVDNGRVFVRFSDGTAQILSAEQQRVTRLIVDTRSSINDKTYAFTITMASPIGYGLPFAEQTIHFSYASLDYAP